VLVGALWDVVVGLWWYGLSLTCLVMLLLLLLLGLGMLCVHRSLFVVVDEEEGVWERGVGTIANDQCGRMCAQYLGYIYSKIARAIMVGWLGG
jgi:hypothetical protein